jgi:hypothetical protein
VGERKEKYVALNAVLTETGPGSPAGTGRTFDHLTIQMCAWQSGGPAGAWMPPAIEGERPCDF